MDDKIIVFKQNWLNCDRYLFVDNRFRGSCQLDIFREPKGENKVEAYLHSLWVNEEYREDGCGSLLLDAVENVARDGGLKYLFLEWDRRESSQDAFDWYIRRGYDDIEFGYNNALMRLELTKNNK